MGRLPRPPGRGKAPAMNNPETIARDVQAGLAKSLGAAFPKPDAWLPHRVSYGETDAMGVVYYGEYPHFFERARSQLIRDRGMSYADVEARGVRLPVREMYLRYRKPLHFDDLVWVRTGVSGFSRAAVTFVYEIHNEAKTATMAEGMTQHACVSREGRPIAAPDWLKALFHG